MNSRIDRFKNRIQALLPTRRKDQFLQRLLQQSNFLVQGGEALIIFMQKPNNKNAQVLRQIEKEADEIRRILIAELNRSFVTPIDREDIFTLSRALDDVLDYMHSIVNEMDILEVRPTVQLQQMAQLLHDAAIELHLAMERLEHHPAVAEDHAVRAKAIDNRMETLYAEALAELFQGPKNLDHVIVMLKLREIYRHMLHAVGSSDIAANIISDIVVKFF